MLRHDTPSESPNMYWRFLRHSASSAALCLRTRMGPGPYHDHTTWSIATIRILEGETPRYQMIFAEPVEELDATHLPVTALSEAGMYSNSLAYLIKEAEFVAFKSLKMWKKSRGEQDADS